jgi:ABC-type transporter Mla MlaB component
MTSFGDLATAVRSGEHACSRVTLTEDRERVSMAFIADALARRHKVVYVRDCQDSDGAVDPAASLRETFPDALAHGQLQVLAAEEVYTPDGTFDIERMLAWASSQRRLAIADGWAGMSVTGDMTTLHEVPGGELVPEYEGRIGEVGEFTLLCQYDHRHCTTGTLAAVASQHHVDIGPELASIGRTGCVAAALVSPGRTLRISGELDFNCAAAVGETIDAHFHGPLRLDLADLQFIDVAGIRALRGRTHQAITIVDASPPARRLMELVAWDTDPAIEILDGTT